MISEIRNVLSNKVIDNIKDKLGRILYEAFKNLVVSGTPPLILSKCKGDNLVDYKIYGNSIQNGTSTVKSIGERTKNLFDINNVNICAINVSGLTKKPKIENGVIYSGGVLGSSEGACIYIDTLGNDSITISFDCNYDETQTTRYYRVYLFNEFDENGYILNVNRLNITVVNSKNKVVVNTTGYKYVGIISFSNTQYGLQITNLQFGQGETAEYELYGYKIPVKVSGKNLLPPISLWEIGSTESWKPCKTSSKQPTLPFTYVPAGSNSYYNVPVCVVKVKPSTKYTLSTNTGLYVVAGEYASLEDTNSASKIIKRLGTYIKSPATFTTSETTEYLVVGLSNWQNSNNVIVDNNSQVMLEESTKVTDYEPYVEPVITNIYLDEPLTINDYIHYKEQELSKNGVITNIELPNIPTIKGTTILEIDTTIQPSNMEVIYKGKE